MFFYFNDTATTEIYTYLHTLSLHDALPIWREDDALGGAGIDLPDDHEVARSDARIGPLKPVEAKDVQPLILLVGPDHARGGGPLARDLHHIPFGKVEFRHHRQRQPGKAAPRILRPGDRKSTRLNSSH